MGGIQSQVPSIGRLVHYCLSEQDVTEIMRRRTSGASIAERLGVHVLPMVALPPGVATTAWPAGAQAHIGNLVEVGQYYPMLIVRVWGATAESAVNGQVFLDGNDVFWATSRTVGDAPGTFRWPVR